jgi:hypothetical protein
MSIANSIKSVIEVLKSMTGNYDLNKLHSATLYSILDYILAKKGFDIKKREELLIGLKQLLPPIVQTLVKTKLETPLGKFADAIQRILESKYIVLDSLASLDYVIKNITSVARKVDNVLIFDALSPIELVVIAGYLESRGFKTIATEVVFINPIGLTRFLTAQMGIHSTLRDVASYIAGQLSARSYFKSSYMDEKVHSIGYMGIEEFVKNVNLKNLAESIEHVACSGNTLILSDHGYDVIWDQEAHYLLVTHGFKEGKFEYEVIAPLSKMAVPLLVYRRY